MRALTLLGPQRREPTLASACERFGVHGQIAAVTAGWQEREGELKSMRSHLGCPVVDLRLHRRCEQIFTEDAELFEAHRGRQNRLRALQQLYRYRLDYAIKPARELLERRDEDPELLLPERAAAIEAVRLLDREHLERIADVHRVFDHDHRPLERPAVARHRREIEKVLDDSATIVIAGGHVATLLNRMRLLSVVELFGDRPIVAWSAGAMVLAGKIALFHDTPPQGAGNAELLDHGLGLYDDLLPLPHARRRLRLDDPQRVALFARRFAPALCVTLDEGSIMTREDGRDWRWVANLRRLAEDGGVEHLEAA